MTKIYILLALLLAAVSCQIGYEAGAKDSLTHASFLHEEAYRNGLTDGARTSALKCPPRANWKDLFEKD